MCCLIACSCKYIVGSHCEVRSHIGNEIKTDNEGYKTDNDCLYHITLGEWQYHWEEVEHTCKGCQWQELVAWQKYCNSKDYRDKDDRRYQGCRMTDNQSRTHTDVHLLTIKLALYQLLCLFRDRLQTFDEERGDTRNQLHNGTHGNTEEENLLCLAFA